MRGMVSYTQRSLAMTVCSDRRQGKPSPKRVPVARVEQVLGLYRDRYFDLNVRHFQEKLQHEHQIELSYTWVKLALQGAGLVRRGRKRGRASPAASAAASARDVVAHRRLSSPFSG